MSSELKAVLVESASDVEGNTTTPQGGVDGQVDESNHHESADGASGYSGPKDEEFLQWEGDPYEYLLKPMLEKDTIQCAAWKEEVQNTLIFAGLFSAVVTAFIIESYQRLQQDSSDVIIGLLAHIADRLDNAPNKTKSSSSVIVNTGFIPSSTDISINVFWFISLVLSLTTALIGIVTLQWLREHQQYDIRLKPQEKMAVLNARLHSLKQWYVPQIFAGLPLLLQSALVLFFTGLIEFLFTLRLEVAVPVTVSICIPLIFLIATTMLPLLQVCILQDAFRLSINNNIPSPCPYKSPQSLIARRIGLGSSTVFRLICSMVAVTYMCMIKIASLRWHVDGHSPPIFHSQRRLLKLRLRDDIPSLIGGIVGPSGETLRNWNAMDLSWARVRTIYALSSQMVHRNDTDLVLARRRADQNEHLLPLLYDCASCFQDAIRDNQANMSLFGALYGCITDLFSKAVQNFDYLSLCSRPADTVLTDLTFAFGRILWDGLDATELPMSVSFIDDVKRHKFHQVRETLSTALTLSLVLTVTKFWGNVIHVGLVERRLAAELVTKQLGLLFDSGRLFSLNRIDTWLPKQVYAMSLEPDLFSSSLVTNCFHAFLRNCSDMQPNSQLKIRPAPAKTAYEVISKYMEINVNIVSTARTIKNLAHLTQLCNSTSPHHLLQHKPFLLIAACIYLDITTQRVDDDEVTPLLQIITTACGTPEGNCDYEGWTGLDDAINAIYKHHNSSQQSTSNRNSSSYPPDPTGDDNHV